MNETLKAHVIENKETVMDLKDFLYFSHLENTSLYQVKRMVQARVNKHRDFVQAFIITKYYIEFLYS